MARKHNRNLRVHNRFTLGPEQPTLPCADSNCPRFFWNLSGRNSHIRAAHPFVMAPPNPPTIPASLAFKSPTPVHMSSPQPPSPILEHSDPLWHNVRSSSPFYGSDKSEEESIAASRSGSASSEHSSERLGHADVNFDKDFDNLDNFAPDLDSEWVDIGVEPQSPMTEDSRPQSNQSSSSSDGTPPSTKRVYHRQLNGQFTHVELCL